MKNQTLATLKVGSRFRSWDNKVYFLTEKTEGRATIVEEKTHVTKEVAHGCEVLEVLAGSCPKAEGKGDKENSMSKETLAALKDAREKKSTKAVKATSKTKAKKDAGGRAKISCFGLPVTAVIRWMGKDEFSVGEAIAALKAQKLSPMPADGTVKIQLNAGKNGERGDPAKLTGEQQKELRDAAKEHTAASAKKTAAAA